MYVTCLPIALRAIDSTLAVRIEHVVTAAETFVSLLPLVPKL